MVSIELECVSNGIVKKILDNNANGAGDKYELKTAYILEDDEINEFKNTINFVKDVLKDLGVYTGNKFSKINLQISTDWGISFKPTKDDIENKINSLKDELIILEELLDDIK